MRPSAHSAAPTKSTCRCSVAASATALRASSSVTATIGMLIAKIHRHEALSTITPPASGPMIIAIPLQAVHEPIALPRTFGGNAATMIASELGVSSAPAAPCSARAAISVPFVRRDRAEQRQHAERADPEHEHAPLPVDVPERAGDEDQRPEREHVGVRDPLLRLQPAAEVVLDRGQRDVDDRPVDGGDGRAEDRGDQRGALDSRHRADSSPVVRAATVTSRRVRAGGPADAVAEPEGPEADHSGRRAVSPGSAAQPSGRPREVYACRLATRFMSCRYGRAYGFERSIS